VRAAAVLPVSLSAGAEAAVAVRSVGLMDHAVSIW
jgi:hypothetical protein